MSEEILSVNDQVLTQAISRSNEIIAELEKDDFKMRASSDGIQDISAENLEENRKASISVMEKVINDINIPELTDFNINPNATQEFLSTKFDKEQTELKIYKSNLRSNSQNMNDTNKTFQNRENLCGDIANGLNNKLFGIKPDELLTNIDKFKDLFSLIKKDFDFVLNRCCPNMKDDVKLILGNLNERRNSGEEDSWITIENDVNAEALVFLLETNIIMKNPVSNTFKLAP